MYDLDDLIIGQYGSGAYLGWTVAPDGKLEVTCPDHGPFRIGLQNFLYHRGCLSCRGVHPRGLPKRSKRRGAVRKRGRPRVAYALYILPVPGDPDRIRLHVGPAAAALQVAPLYCKHYADKRTANAGARSITLAFPTYPAAAPLRPRTDIPAEYLPAVIATLAD